MTLFKSLLNCKVLDIFRGYVRGIFADSDGDFAPRSTSFCIYKRVPDALSHSIKDLVLHILDEESKQVGERRALINVVDLNLMDLVTDDCLSVKAPRLPLETFINKEFERIFRSRPSKSNSFVVLELPRHFRPRSLLSKIPSKSRVESDLSADSGSDDHEQPDKDAVHFGVFNTTTDEPSDELEESIYRVLRRFVERAMMEEGFNTHLVLLSPCFKPPCALLGRGMFEIHLPIEWEASKSNLIRLIQEVFEDADVDSDAIEMIVASTSHQEEALSHLAELCFELKHFLATKYVGRRILEGADPDLGSVAKVSTQDVHTFLQDFNAKKLVSYYSSSIDSVIATKISIDDDFVGLDELRKSIKKSIAALECCYEHSRADSNQLEETSYGYPVSWFLWGSHGSGKSTLVRSMVSISPKVKVLFCNAIDLISPLHGVTTRNLRRLFKNALNSRPSVLVFDDIETLGVLSREDDLSEGEARSKINRELASTLLYLLDSVISISRDLASGSVLSPKLEDSSDQFNYGISRKVPGLMIVMTSRSDMSSFPPELLFKVQRHSFLQLPSTEELLQGVAGNGCSELSVAARQVADEIRRLQGDRLINFSEFKALVQNRLYEKYARREADSNTP